VAERREDEQSARLAAEDAMIALADRVRPIVAKDPQYTRALAELQTAEELVRSRDQGLAREQDAHAERLRAVDQRMAKIEEELEVARKMERAAVEALADAEAELARVQARLKRAEIEQRKTGKEG
jgi:chromosome segregation ATPase